MNSYLMVLILRYPQNARHIFRTAIQCLLVSYNLNKVKGSKGYSFFKYEPVYSRKTCLSTHQKHSAGDEWSHLLYEKVADIFPIMGFYKTQNTFSVLRTLYFSYS